MKKIFLAFLVFFLFGISSSFAASFSDVPESHKNYQAIESLKQYGIIKGYADGTFKPENTINRAEATKIVLLGSGIEVDGKTSNTIFSDVPGTEWFAPYVLKAKNLGVVKGNPDGRFLPANPINLAEILKIVLNSNGVKISLQIPSTKPYADVPTDQWFAPYFVYAKEQKLLDQSSSQLVVPGHAISRAELAEIMYRLRNVLETEKKEISYASYFSDALHGNTTASGELYDKNAFTAAHRDIPFGTRVEVTNTLNNKSVIVRINDRGPKVDNRVVDLSKAAFEAISPLSKGVIPVFIRVIDDNTEQISQIDQDAQENCSWNKNEESIEKDFFVNKEQNINIELYKNLRTSYFPNEVFDVSGKVFDQSITEVTAFLKDESGKQFIFTAPVKNGDFMVQIEVGEPGEKQLSFIPGRSGKNYVANIQVENIDCEKVLSENSSISSANNYRFAIENNELILRWENQNAKLSRIIIKQGAQMVVRYFGEGKKGWRVHLSAFEMFSQGEFSVRVDIAESAGDLLERNTAWKVGEFTSFIAGQHHFSENNAEYIQISPFSATYGFGGEIAFQGRTKASIRPEMALITPSGDVEIVPFVTSAPITENAQGIKEIAANASFSVAYTPKEHGTYIVEMNHASGIAAFNYPIYEAGTIPIIPDFMDIKLSSAFQAQNLAISIPSFSAELLGYINQERRAAMKDMVEMDESLQILAQARADDMAKNNYFSHWNTSGKDANDIRISYGIKTAVGENLAKETSVLAAHDGLMRSALHRKNILDDYWSRVGFGFAKASDGGLIVVEIFSAAPIEDNDLPRLREELLDLVNSQRAEFLIPSATLTSVAQDWSDKMVQEDFFDFQNSQGVSLSDQIRKGGVLQTVGTFILGNSSWLDLRNYILENEEVKNTRWKKMGVGIRQDVDGIIKVTVLYSE